MFMGTYYNSIDAKNRMIVPSKHRDQLSGRCVVTKGLDKCIYIYSVKEWEKQMDKIEQLPESDPKVRDFIRHFCSNAEEIEIDKQGRMLLPAELRKYADIEKELVTMGAMKKIEVWAKEVWDAPDNSCRMDSTEFATSLKEYNF